MKRRFLAIAGGIALLELLVALLLGELTSAKTAAMILVVSTVIGAAVFVGVCLACWRRAADQLAVGNLIEDHEAMYLVVLFGAFLLLLPGLLTDLVGLILLATPLRRHAAVWLRDRMFNERKSS